MYDFLLQLFDIFRTAIGMRTPEELEREVVQRKKAEKALKRANDELERRVWERTGQLARMNATLKTSEERLQRDITARMQTEEALRHSEEQFRRAIVDAPIPIIMHAEDGEILQISKAWTRLSGYTRADLPNYQTWLKLAYGRDAPRVAAHVKSLFQLQVGIREEEFVITTKSGERRTWVFTNAAPGKFKDGRRFLVGMAMDVTDRRDADRRKDEFLATLAHELRNPLAPISNAIEVMGYQGPLDPQAQWAHAVLQRQVQQMTRLVDDLLDVSRISRGKVELCKQRVELAILVSRAVETTRPLIQERRHELSLALPTEPVWLEVDPTRLEQVLANLINNAAKYTEVGGSIRLSAARESGAVVIRVRDSGIGIAPDKLQHVFDMFVQVDDGKNRAMGGLGIGLSLVRGLVELHGGTVAAASEGAAKGSEFTVQLPLPPARMADQRLERPETVSSPAVVPPCRLLVVDDNVDAAETLAHLLRLQGHDVHVAHDGLAALEQAPVVRPQVAILDIGMPKMDGYEVARRLRGLAGLETLRLVALTGWGNEEDRRRARDAGFDRHLVKPVELSALREVLLELVN
jgi:PAS domain S-box-containing protein